MRGIRAFRQMFFFIAILAIALFITYFSWWNSTQGSLNNYNAGAFSIGRMFYSLLFTVQALLVAVIMPSLTSGGISIEKEQRTFELLTVSQMSRNSIVWGKLLSALAFVALLLTASLPLVALSFLLGGVSPGEVLSAYGLLLLTAFLYGAVGIACSAVASNTTSATTMTYGAIILIFLATLPTAMVGTTGAWGAPGLAGTAGVGLVALNPIGALVGGTQSETYFGISVPAWGTALVINGLFGFLLTLVALHRLDFPRTDRSGVLRLLTGVLVGLFAFCICGMFLPGNNNLFGAGTFYLVTNIMVISLIPLVPIFATAEGLPTEGGVTTLFRPKHLARGEAPSGMVYVILLMLLVGGIAWLGAQFGPSSSGVTVERVQQAIFATTLLAVSLAFGYGSWGVLLSALTQNRWGAFSITAATMVILYMIPLSIVSARSAMYATPDFTYNFLYITPIAGAAVIATELQEDITKNTPPSSPNTGTPNAAPTSPPAPETSPSLIAERQAQALLFGETPLYVVMSWLSVVCGIVCLFLAARVHKRKEQLRRETLALSEQGNNTP